jgi:hypothetical protein
VSAGEFSYSGPSPQSREAALIMLADVVEASSRALADPTPSRIRAHVEKIVKGVFAEGQLDATELTFKDLDKVTDSFVIILTGIFHKRIEYPDKVPPKPTMEEPHFKARPVPPVLSPHGPAQAQDDADYNAARWLSNGERAPHGARKITPAAPRVADPKRAARPKPKRAQAALEPGEGMALAKTVKARKVRSVRASSARGATEGGSEQSGAAPKSAAERPTGTDA